MNPVALASDFARLPTDIQQSHIRVLRQCDAERLSCRCEMNGRDFTIVISRGLSSAKYWLDQYEPLIPANVPR